jgi:hypothetical protein
MKTKHILLITLNFLLISCIINKPINYQTNDIEPAQESNTFPINVEIWAFDDNRRNFDDNQVLFNNNKQTRLEKDSYCINSERHYKHDLVNNQITKMLVHHLIQEKVFKLSVFGHCTECDYYLTGKINNFYGHQLYSTAAAVGAQFGLIGSMATSTLTSQGLLIIEFSDIKLHSKKDNRIIKDFGNFYKAYEKHLPVDASCWCIYDNMNLMLKDFNHHLIQKIRYDLKDLRFYTN